MECGWYIPDMAGCHGGVDYLPKAFYGHNIYVAKGGADYLPKALPFQGVALG